MGYLTTFTVYIDGLDLLKTHPEDFCKKLYSACLRGHKTDFGIGYFANFAHVQASRHADDHTIYVHMGNCVTEVNPFSQDFENIVECNPEFAKKLVGFIEKDLKRLKKMVEK